MYFVVVVVKGILGKTGSFLRGTRGFSYPAGCGKRRRFLGGLCSVLVVHSKRKLFPQKFVDYCPRMLEVSVLMTFVISGEDLTKSSILLMECRTVV